MAKATTKKPYHTITVRLKTPEYEYLKACKAESSEAEGRSVPYTEILIKGLRATREASLPKAARAR
jgi:hypothetical protein